MTHPGDSSEMLLSALLSSDCWDEDNGEVSMQILPSFLLSRVDFQPSISTEKRERNSSTSMSRLEFFLTKEH